MERAKTGSPTSSLGNICKASRVTYSDVISTVEKAAKERCDGIRSFASISLRGLVHALPEDRVDGVLTRGAPRVYMQVYG
jgi:hypothetical protein